MLKYGIAITELRTVSVKSRSCKKPDRYLLSNLYSPVWKLFSSGLIYNNTECCTLVNLGDIYAQISACQWCVFFFVVAISVTSLNKEHWSNFSHKHPADLTYYTPIQPSPNPRLGLRPETPLPTWTWRDHTSWSPLLPYIQGFTSRLLVFKVTVVSVATGWFRWAQAVRPTYKSTTACLKPKFFIFSPHTPSSNSSNIMNFKRNNQLADGNYNLTTTISKQFLTDIWFPVVEPGKLPFSNRYT